MFCKWIDKKKMAKATILILSIEGNINITKEEKRWKVQKKTLQKWLFPRPKNANWLWFQWQSSSLLNSEKQKRLSDIVVWNSDVRKEGIKKRNNMHQLLFIFTLYTYNFFIRCEVFFFIRYECIFYKILGVKW